MTIEKIQERKGKVEAELNQLTFSEDVWKKAYLEAIETNNEEKLEEARKMIAQNGAQYNKLLKKLRNYNKMLGY